MSIPRLPRPAHVLIVDDDRTNRVVATKLCQLFGSTVETTDTGEQAVCLCATGAFDLVLMDIRMPRMNGIDAAIAIRALPGPASQVPMIAVTGDVCSETEALCREAGMNAFVEKPIGALKLFEAMSAALDATDERLVPAGRRALVS